MGVRAAPKESLDWPLFIFIFAILHFARTVTYEEGEELAKANGLLFIEASS
eukprot:COSAG05_NODE_9168_length_642_cov_118.362799_2_plen_50_part_01